MYKKYLILFFAVISLNLIAQDIGLLNSQQQRQLQQQMFSQSGGILQGTSPFLGENITESGGNVKGQANQITNFRKYIQELNESIGETEVPYYVDDRMYEGDSLYREFIKYDDSHQMKVFGSDIFNRIRFTFEPNLYIPTPANYLIGTNDELLVDISGLYDVSYKLKVNPEGKIRIPNAGLIVVGGLTIDAATNVLKRELSKYYTGISTDQTHVSVSLGNIRSIKIIIAGEARYPGTYTLPSLATVINALYVCGGPGKIGSMRNINLVRNGKTVAKIDLYKFLTTGVMHDNVGLQDNDVILIEPNKSKIIIDGAISRRGIYEFKEGESMLDMLNYAGGFGPDANRSLTSVYRYTNHQKTVLDIPEEYLSTSMVKHGDSIYISAVEDIFDNKIELAGAVYRPGVYAFVEGMTVKTLIEKAGGVTDEAFMNMASIKRHQKNEVPAIISFNLGKLISGEAKDIELHKDDYLMIESLSSFMENQQVYVQGEVIKPGEYNLVSKMTVKDLIFQAKGFTEKASTENIQLIRILKDPTLMDEGSKKSITITFSVDKNLNISDDGEDIVLENGDVVVVRAIEGIEPIRMVSIEGEVKNPGFYNIGHKDICVSDLIEMSGGFTQYAFTNGAYIIRNESKDDNPNAIHNVSAPNLNKILIARSQREITEIMQQKMRAESVVKLDTLEDIFVNIDEKRMQELLNFSGVISLDISAIIKNPRGVKDILIEDGDVLYIPKRSQTVKVIGEVMYPSFVIHNSSRVFRDYVTSSGGFSYNALKKKSFVLYPNGRVKGTKSFLGIKMYPEVTAGSIIIVPKKDIDISTKLSTAEFVSISSSITSVMALIYAYAFK